MSFVLLLILLLKRKNYMGNTFATTLSLCKTKRWRKIHPRASCEVVQCESSFGLGNKSGQYMETTGLQEPVCFLSPKPLNPPHMLLLSINTTVNKERGNQVKRICCITTWFWIMPAQPATYPAHFPPLYVFPCHVSIGEGDLLPDPLLQLFFFFL